MQSLWFLSSYMGKKCIALYFSKVGIESLKQLVMGTSTILCSPIYLCASPTVPPYCDKLPWRTKCLGGHSGSLEHINVIERLGRLGVAPKCWCGDRAPCCCSWNPMSSNAKTSHVCSNLHRPYSWKIRPIKHPSLLVALNVMIYVISTKPKINVYMVVGTKFLLRTSIVSFVNKLANL